jgi:hypothetical protein
MGYRKKGDANFRFSYISTFHEQLNTLNSGFIH